MQLHTKDFIAMYFRNVFRSSLRLHAIFDELFDQGRVLVLINIVTCHFRPGRIVRLSPMASQNRTGASLNQMVPCFRRDLARPIVVRPPDELHTGFLFQLISHVGKQTLEVFKQVIPDCFLHNLYRIFFAPHGAHQDWTTVRMVAR